MAGESVALERAPAHNPKYRRVTIQQAKTILELRKLGKTQTEIGQALNLDHSTVSRWLSATEDTRDLAQEHLAHNALRMAKSVVNGPTHVQLKALQGLGVAAEGSDSGPRVVIQIGGTNTDVQVMVAGKAD